MTTPELPADLRLILFHKHKTSARLRFLRLPQGICAFSPLPRDAALEEAAPSAPVSYHPNAWLRQVEQWLGLASGDLEAEVEFSATVSSRDGPIQIHLAALKTMDPPFTEAEAVGGRFVAITEARDCSPVELELLRRAYTVVLG